MCVRRGLVDKKRLIRIGGRTVGCRDRPPPLFSWSTKRSNQNLVPRLPVNDNNALAISGCVCWKSGNRTAQRFSLVRLRVHVRVLINTDKSEPATAAPHRTKHHRNWDKSKWETTTWPPLWLCVMDNTVRTPPPWSVYVPGWFCLIMTPQLSL